MRRWGLKCLLSAKILSNPHFSDDTQSHFVPSVCVVRPALSSLWVQPDMDDPFSCLAHLVHDGTFGSASCLLPCVWHLQFSCPITLLPLSFTLSWAWITRLLAFRLVSLFSQLPPFSTSLCGFPLCRALLQLVSTLFSFTGREIICVL